MWKEKSGLSGIRMEAGDGSGEEDAGSTVDADVDATAESVAVSALDDDVSAVAPSKIL